MAKSDIIDMIKWCAATYLFLVSVDQAVDIGLSKYIEIKYEAFISLTFRVYYVNGPLFN